MDVVLSSTSAALGGGRRRESGGAVGEKLAVSPGGCRLAVSLRCREVITPDGDAHASALPLPLTPPLDPRCVQLRQAPGSPGAWRRQSFVTTADRKLLPDQEEFKDGGDEDFDTGTEEFII
uniref:Uncharacterized protein n=1 Tax=Oryza nivara TaxID=4536 RepID=A0A0E0G4C2_ORYNI